MALIVKDRVQETSTTTGTGTLTLAGAISGFQTFSSAIGNGNTTYYAIVGGTEWEVGIGTIGAGTLARTTLLASSTGSAVSFSAGIKNVFCTYAASKSVTIDDIQTLTNKTINLASNTLTGTTAQFNTALSDGDFATLAGTETLTNKTLTSPTVTGGALNGTLGATTPSTVAATTISASGVSTFSAGTAAAPAITTTGDTNTGIFFPAADTIAFSEGGAEAMRIDSSGNLGIGATAPAGKLDVAGTIAISPGNALATIRRTTVNGSYGISIQGNINDTINDTNAGSKINIGGGPITGDAYAGRIDLTAYGNLTDSTSNIITFNRRTGVNTTAESMRIDASGNLTSTGTISDSTAILRPIVSATAVATTSGTAIDFTGIPSWVKRITIMLDGVSTNSTSVVLIQIGDSGGIENTGYTAHAGVIQGGSVGSTDYTTGYGLSNDNIATNALSGSYTITNLSGNLWTLSGSARQASSRIAMAAGSKTLSATLDRVRLTTVIGTNTFDAGSVNIIYE